MKIVVTLLKLISLLMILSSCSNKKETMLSNLPPLNEGFSVFLEKPVSLESKQAYNLHWNSDIPEHLVSYSININGKLFKKNHTKTVVSGGGNIMEFNVPSTDFSISSEILQQGNNTLQIIAQYNGAEMFKSNEVEIDKEKSSFVVNK